MDGKSALEWQQALIILFTLVHSCNFAKNYLLNICIQKIAYAYVPVYLHLNVQIKLKHYDLIVDPNLK